MTLANIRAPGSCSRGLIELDFSVDRFNLRWSDVTAEEARGLRLKEERDRRAEEQRKEMEREQALARQRR